VLPILAARLMLRFLLSGCVLMPGLMTIMATLVTIRYRIRLIVPITLMKVLLKLLRLLVK
jgi:hypothetical protein